MTVISLRLAQAFTRAAAPEGHEPVADLPSLRAHMREVHGFEAAGMVPLRVLLHLHEDSHEQGEPHERGTGDDWYSPDTARSPGFVAARHRTAGQQAPGRP